MSLIVLDEAANDGVRFVKYHCTVCGYVGAMRKHHFNAGTGCRVCNGKEVLRGYNDVATTRPDLVKYFKNKDDAFRITARSGQKVTTKCPVCGLERQSRMSDLSKRGHRCPICYGGFSIPNRYMSAVLSSIGMDFVPEKTFLWSGRFRYDFYLPDIETIVEMHGNQHYNDRAGWSKLSRVRELDKQKMSLAAEHGILHYFTIPADKSDVEYLRESVIMSGLLERIGILPQDVDWTAVNNLTMAGVPQRCLDLWQAGTRDVKTIARIVKISTDSVSLYLKEYASFGLCDYSVYDQKKIGLELAHEHKKRPVICQTTGEMFDSIRAASKQCGISERALQNHLKGRCQSSGKDANGCKLKWKYYIEE